MYHCILLLLFTLATATTAPICAEENDYPADTCWVVSENATLELEKGKRVPLELGEGLYIIDIEDQRLFVARLRLGRIQAQGWVDKRHVANCFDTVPQFDPEFTGKAVVGFRPYLAIAQARYEVTLTPGTVTSTGTWTRIDECLEAAERLAPGNLQVLWERAMLPQHKPVAERIRLLDAVISREPENALVFFWRAMARRESNNRSGAIADFQRAVDIFERSDGQYANQEHLKKLATEYLLELREGKSARCGGRGRPLDT